MNKKAKVLVMTPNMIGMVDGINRIQPCHGPGLIAGNLRDRGHEVYFRDTALEGYSHVVPKKDSLVTIGEDEEATARYISEVQPDWVVVSILFSNLAEHGKTLARIAKSVNPNIKTALGGNHVNNTYRDTIRDPNVDFIVRGEADFNLEKVVSAEVNGEDFSSVPGIIFKSDGEVIEGPPTQRIGLEPGTKRSQYPLDVLPRKARDLMNMEGYFKIGLPHSSKTKRKVGSVMASRGCPEECTFCTTPQMWGNVVRWRSPENVAQEIKDIQSEFGIEEVQFEDDTLTSNRKNLLELCDLIEPLGVYWCTPNGVKVNYHSQNPEIQAHLFRRMKESGCYQITFAVESGSQRVLDEIVNKRLPLDTVKPTIEAAKEAGMLVHTFFMVGLPGETYEEMQETVRFAESIEADSYSIAITCPLPGTPIYQVAKQKNLFVENFSEDQILYRRALLKVPGFSSPEDFENWVDEQNQYLNTRLKERDPSRFELKYGTDTDERTLRKQT